MGEGKLDENSQKAQISSCKMSTSKERRGQHDDYR